MMHHCCSSSQQGHIMGGTCTCGMFHPQTNSNYSLIYSNYQQHDHCDFDPYSYTTPSSSSSSSVDCTLSLATPSTRLSEDQDKRNRRSSLANFFCTKSSNTKHNSQSQSKSNNIGSNSNNDSLLARRCASCDSTSTPLWRNGPRGPKSLCNACGIRYKKEERRANAAVATTAATNGGIMESGNFYSNNNNNNSWYSQPQSQMYGNELRFMDDSDAESENGIPNFLSWRLNTSLVHDYTR
ncbi:putative transcription factor C2C2-GATA family [Medicago truncatula]|uniref:GATA type zinc finger transcription factor family protein n=1 Tax=Medicago truncatula TaxID=3880 RepID=G7LE01_MEDTR|nr:GATA transcription factor 18 [Medicago truncatula]AET03916.1 GATA type zinc finger transcription factor family protein [Medicago truncatula]RHN42105.1 putative transcription factor C2C2-GATA family [Medicago truncatula]